MGISMDYIVAFGLLAGVLQAAGYLLYYWYVIRVPGKLEEPLTWLMFAYGTALLTTMELDSMYRSAMESGTGIGMLSVLILPIICSVGALLVGLNIWLREFKVTGRKWPDVWRVDWKTDRGVAFALDLALTAMYAMLWVMTIIHPDTASNEHLFWVTTFLLVSNATTAPGFYPLLLETAKNPSCEDWRPWAVWAIAYTALSVSVFGYASTDISWPTSINPFMWSASFWHFIALISYPIPNAIFHGWVAVLAAPARQKKTNQ